MQSKQDDLHQIGTLCAEYCEKYLIEHITVFGGFKKGSPFYFISEGSAIQEQNNVFQNECPYIL